MTQTLTRILCCILLITSLGGCNVYAQKRKTTKQQLQAQQQQTTAARKKSQAQATQLNKNIQAALDTVILLDNQIEQQQHDIDSLNNNITTLQQQITALEEEMARLREQLSEKKTRYVRAMVNMQRHRKLQNKLLFIFSAKNFDQAIRRLRYTQEYSAFLRAQGQMIKQQQADILRKQNELLAAKTKLETHRVALQEQMALLEQAKDTQQEHVKYLNKNLKTLQRQIKEYQRKEADLNKQIDRIIQEEIAEARRKAEAERKRREEAARAAANASNAADKSAARTTERAIERAAAADTKLSTDFVANKGRLPMPVTGNATIIRHYGRYTVSGLSHVQLDNKGIDIRAQQGAQARAIFDGTVAGVYQIGTANVILLRHGEYISVYSGIDTPAVTKGEHVSTRQNLGTLATDDNEQPTLHFQLRKQSQRLNPEQWIKR